MTTPTLTDRVQAGAAWLDEQRPGWWQPDRLDLDKFDLWNCYRCLLGQEFAADAAAVGDRSGYWYALSLLNKADLGPDELGFNAAGGAELTALAAAWRELILARRVGTETAR